MLRQEMDELIGAYKTHKHILEHNSELFSVFEGDLVTAMSKQLKDDMSADTYSEIMSRAAPINILPKMIDKLSKIYAKSPLRQLSDNATDYDLELLEYYVKSMDMNSVMGAKDGANGLFNLFKNTWVEPFIDGVVPSLRVIPSDRFFVYSKDMVNPTRPTHFVKVMGKQRNSQGVESVILYAYTKDEFLPFTDSGEVLESVLAELENPEGINPLGVLPGIYINRSRYFLMPKPDADTLAMTKLIPIQLSDINYGLKYQCFSIVYTIDADQTNLVSAPNALWDLKSDKNSDKAPQIGVIKPEVDSDKALSLVKSLLSMWMQSRNIKPGAMGDLSVENAASGIAKAIDEMDTSEDRQAQIPYFEKAENALWDMIINNLHPVWSKYPGYKHPKLFTPGVSVMVNFHEQKAILKMSDVIADQKAMLDLGLQTKSGALKEIYPALSETEIEEKLLAVESENESQSVEFPVNPEVSV